MIKKILFFLLMTLCFSCEEQGLFIKCPDCTAVEPTSTELDIKLDIAYSGATVLINVYEGNIEDSVIYRSFNSSGTKTSVTVSVNKKYTLTATYNFPESKYISVDSSTPRVRYDKIQCDEPCYIVFDKVVNLRLKYME